jgi:hypothetical protein
VYALCNSDHVFRPDNRSYRVEKYARIFVLCGGVQKLNRDLLILAELLQQPLPM